MIPNYSGALPAGRELTGKAMSLAKRPAHAKVRRGRVCSGHHRR